MKKLLVIVDMQNDFVTGSLANPDAEKIVPGIVELIKNWDGKIVATSDTHSDKDYLKTQEGKRLPIKHCINGTDGWLLVPEIGNALQKPKNKLAHIFCKTGFGSTKLAMSLSRTPFDELNKDFGYDEIYFCGTCTDICVISNAIICKSFDPEARIIVLKDLCAGTTPENHENALKAMKQCQIDIE